MNKSSQLKRVIAPGIWEDMNGRAHLDVPALHKLFDIEDTPENRKITMAMLREMLLKQDPGRIVIERMEKPKE